MLWGYPFEIKYDQIYTSDIPKEEIDQLTEIQNQTLTKMVDNESITSVGLVSIEAIVDGEGVNVILRMIKQDGGWYVYGNSFTGDIDVPANKFKTNLCPE